MGFGEEPGRSLGGCRPGGGGGGSKARRACGGRRRVGGQAAEGGVVGVEAVAEEVQGAGAGEGGGDLDAGEEVDAELAAAARAAGRPATVSWSVRAKAETPWSAARADDGGGVEGAVGGGGVGVEVDARGRAARRGPSTLRVVRGMGGDCSTYLRAPHLCFEAVPVSMG